MIPRTILGQLARLRRREYLLRFTWGTARCLALVLILLTVACLADWTLDRLSGTPWAVRVLMLLLQVAAGAAAVLLLLALPLARRPADAELALLVEDKVPDLHHRLISAVELNAEGANTGGMSGELIATVTREAEERASRLNFAHVLDTRRLRWSAALVLPLAAVLALPVLLWWDTVSVLLARQLLEDREIPRSVYLTSAGPAVAPSGEEVVLLFRAEGKAISSSQTVPEVAAAAVGLMASPLGAGPCPPTAALVLGRAKRLEGVVRIYPEGEPAQHYPLYWAPVPGAEPGQEYFVARVPAAVTDFSYRAWLADGRTAEPGQLHYVARPAIVEQQAWVLLPPYVQPRPDGSPYELKQPEAEVIALADSSVRVRVQFQKPVVRAEVHLLGVPEAAADETSPLTPEAVLDTIPMRTLANGTVVEAVFPLRPKDRSKSYGRLTGYRVLAWDENGFENSAPPRRSIRIVTEEPPQVALMPEVFLPEGLASANGSAEDFQIEGMPIPPDGRIRVAYTCSGQYGLGGAQLRYRVLRKEERKEGESTVEVKTPWVTLPLYEVAGSKESGPFDPRRGAFKYSRDNEQVQFHAVEPEHSEQDLPRTLGGGRFDFETKSLNLRPGDQLEFYVEVFPLAFKKPSGSKKAGNSSPELDESRPVGRSETRVKGVVAEPEFRQWLSGVTQEELRIRRLASGQESIFRQR